MLDWARQIGDALDYLHNDSPIVRDIKPSIGNHPTGLVKLVDFGLVAVGAG